MKLYYWFIFFATVSIVSTIVIMALGERADILIYKSRQVLGIKTLLEYFVDFELEREEHLPMSIPECAWNGNMTN
jgi:hypothetical protein